MSSVSDEKQTRISDEKQTHSSDVEVPSQSSLNSPKNEHSGAADVQGKDIDKAYLFLAEHSVGDDSIDLKALRRKIDWRIVPIMFLCYVMQFVDKVMINVRLRQCLILTYPTLTIYISMPMSWEYQQTSNSTQRVISSLTLVRHFSSHI